MSYIQDNLMPNEKILFSAKIHPAVFLRSILLIVVTIIIFIIGLNNTEITSSGSTPSAPSLSGIMGPYIICGSGFVFLYSIILGLQALIVMFKTEFAVTNHRIIAKTGFIRRHTLEMLLPKIESVAVSQSILGRVLNFGTVTVTGTGGTKESFRAIVDPINIRKNINQIIERFARMDSNSII
jgi:uncharacterized membrane protein YdbT with pleckstrin-like domain